MRRQMWMGWLLCLLALSVQAQQRLQDLVTVQGERANALVGYGLVVGLDGTGDTGGQTPYATQSIGNMLTSLGVALPPGVTAQSRNVAAVMVTADLPPGAQPGQALDVTVSSLGNARSLKGGTLLLTPLRAANGQIYAQAQGSMVVPGQFVADRGSFFQQGQQSSGRVPAGARVELAAPDVTLSETVELQLKRSEYAYTQRILTRLQNALGADQVQAVDQRRVRVRMPADPAQRLERMAQLMALDVERAPETPKVVVNSRTGTVVMNQLVQVSAFAVTHAMVSSRVQSYAYAWTPNYQSWNRTPLVYSGSQIGAQPGENTAIVHIRAGTSLEDVVQQLNRIGTTPQDLISILQAMKQAGALHADLELL